MSEANPAESMSGGTQTAHSPGRVLAVVLPIAVVGLAAYWWSTKLESQARSDMASSVVGRMFTAEPMPTGGALAFADADNDLVADPPTDPTKLINPDVLVFSYVATEEGGPSEDTWTELTAALKEKTGKEVKVSHFPAADEQMTALQKGELHIVGLNTGLVQKAVEQYGFVPLCTLGRADGSWGYTMEFLRRPAARSRN